MTEPTTSEEPVNDECSICRGEFIDASTLDSCVHKFCFNCIKEWLKKGPGPVCPMCKAAISYITHNLETDDPQIVYAADIRSAAEPPPMEREDLQTEKRIISAKCRECRRRISALEEKIERERGSVNRRKSEIYEAQKAKTVAQLNGLQMLRDDIRNGSPKSMIVSKTEFRKLLYTENVTMLLNRLRIPPRRNVTPAKIVENEQFYRSIIVPFIVEEFKAMPFLETGSQMKKSDIEFPNIMIHELLGGRDAEIAGKIFEIMKKYSLDNSKLVNAIENLIGFSCAKLGVFISQLTALVQSGLEFYDFCGKVVYRLENEAALMRNEQRNARQEIVVLSDDDDENDDSDMDGELQVIREVQGPRVPCESIPSVLQRLFQRSMQQRNNYTIGGNFFGGYHPFHMMPVLRNDGVTSSDDDDDARIYQRDNLRLPQFNLPTLHQQPTIEQSWEQLTSGLNGEGSSNTANNDVVVLSDEEENGGNDDRKFDQTIVLDDSRDDELMRNGESHVPYDLRNRFRKPDIKLPVKKINIPQNTYHLRLQNPEPQITEPKSLSEEDEGKRKERSHRHLKSKKQHKEKRRSSDRRPSDELVKKMEELLDKYGFSEKDDSKMMRKAFEIAIKNKKHELKRNGEGCSSQPVEGDNEVDLNESLDLFDEAAGSEEQPSTHSMISVNGNDESREDDDDEISLNETMVEERKTDNSDRKRKISDVETKEVSPVAKFRRIE